MRPQSARESARTGEQGTLNAEAAARTDFGVVELEATNIPVTARGGGKSSANGRVRGEESDVPPGRHDRRDEDDDDTGDETKDLEGAGDGEDTETCGRRRKRK